MPSVPDFVHTPGHHCGSTALRNLLNHHGATISEEMAFGLGAGACFYYVALEEASPTRWFNGRTARLEENFDELTGAALELRTFDRGDRDAWRAAKAEVDAGKPVLLLTDLYYLDHYGNSAHFPGHAVVLTGYDDEHAYVADTGFEEIQRTSRAGLEKARFAQHPFYPLSGHMVDLPPGTEIEIEGLRERAPEAIAAAAKLMHEPALGDFEGLPALRKFAAEVGSWPEAATDWQWCARFNYQVIERRGTGGGNFRAMYSRFLAEVGRDDEAALCAAASAEWTRLAEALFTASESDEPDAGLWSEVEARAAAVLEGEERLWDALGS
jgi:hypothetical protein